MSSGNEVIVEYVSKMGPLLRDQIELNKSQLKLVQGYEKITAATKTARQSMTEEQRYAERVTREHLTTSERLKAEQAKLTDAFVKTQISYVTYKRASQKIDQELLADAERAKRLEEERGRAAQTRLGAENNGLRNLATNAARSMMSITGVGSALAAVGTLASVVKADYEHWLEQRRESAAFGREYGEIKSTALLNAPTGMTGAQFDQLAKEIQAATGGRDLKSIGTGLAPAFSVSSSGTPEQMKQFMVGAYALNRNDAAANAMAKQGLVLGNSLGMGDQPENVFGFLAAAQAQSVVTSAEEYAQPAAQVLGNAEVNRLGVRDSAALFGTMTRAMDDPTGRQASTAAIQFQQQLAPLRKSLGLGDDAGLDEILTGLQKNKSVAGRLLGSGRRQGTLHGEEKAIAFLRNIAEGGDWYQKYQQARSQIPEIGDAAPFYRAKVAQQRGDATIGIINDVQKLEGLGQSFVGEQQQVAQGMTLESFNKAIDKSPLGYLKREQMKSEMYRGVNWWKNDPTTTAADVLESHAEGFARDPRSSMHPDRAEAYRKFAETAGELRGDPQSTAELVEVLKQIESNTRKSRGEANGSPPNLHAPAP